MRPSIKLLQTLPLVGTLGCMPTDVDYSPTNDVTGDCQTVPYVRIQSANDARSLPQQCFNVTDYVEVVDSPDMVDLDALRFLRRTNRLTIRGNLMLGSTAGLDDVKVVEELEIVENPMLGDVIGLDGTDTVRQVTITDNPQLTSLAGLDQLRKVGSGGFSLRYNGGPENLRELKTLERIEGPFQIENNTDMLNLETGRALVTIGELVVRGNTGLTSLELNVKTVTSNITIVGNAALNKLDGFQELEQVSGDLTIEGNGTLSVLDGFTAKFQTVGGTLSIDNNVSLTDIYLLAVNLYSVGGSVIVTNNTALSQCRAEDVDYYIEQIGGLLDIGDNGDSWEPCH